MPRNTKVSECLKTLRLLRKQVNGSKSCPLKELGPFYEAALRVLEDNSAPDKPDKIAIVRMNRIVFDMIRCCFVAMERAGFMPDDLVEADLPPIKYRSNVIAQHVATLRNCPRPYSHPDQAGIALVTLSRMLSHFRHLPQWIQARDDLAAHNLLVICGAEEVSVIDPNLLFWTSMRPWGTVKYLEPR